MIKDDSDASLRQLRGYVKVYKDPPLDTERRRTPLDGDERRVAMQNTRLRMADLIVAEFGVLDELLSGGGRVPEEWDPALGNKRRARLHSFPFVHVFPPGSTGTMCPTVGKDCEWFKIEAGGVVCVRCHTIRFRVDE